LSKADEVHGSRSIEKKNGTNVPLTGGRRAFVMTKGFFVRFRQSPAATVSGSTSRTRTLQPSTIVYTSAKTMEVERRQRERRERERRTTLRAVDVTRIEHENLFGQVAELLRLVRRMEGELQSQRSRIERLESRNEALSGMRPR
jgi:hypothetical protein